MEKKTGYTISDALNVKHGVYLFIFDERRHVNVIANHRLRGIFPVYFSIPLSTATSTIS